MQDESLEHVHDEAPVDVAILGGGLRLRTASVDDGLALAQVVGDLAVVTIRGEDDDHPVSLLDGASHGSRGAGGLVVGVGVEEDDGGHVAHHVHGNRRSRNCVPCQ